MGPKHKSKENWKLFDLYFFHKNLTTWIYLWRQMFSQVAVDVQRENIRDSLWPPRAPLIICPILSFYLYHLHKHMHLHVDTHTNTYTHSHMHLHTHTHIMHCVKALFSDTKSLSVIFIHTRPLSLKHSHTHAVLNNNRSDPHTHTQGLSLSQTLLHTCIVN